MYVCVCTYGCVCCFYIYANLHRVDVKQGFEHIFDIVVKAVVTIVNTVFNEQHSKHFYIWHTFDKTFTYTYKRQTRHKQDTNKTQTRDKQETNKRQTGDKQETNRRQTGDKQEIEKQKMYNMDNQETTTGYFKVPWN